MPQVARGYLSEAQAKAFFSRRARECEAAGRLKEAEKAYVQVGAKQ
jgi:intraflagellar transport protein 172